MFVVLLDGVDDALECLWGVLGEVGQHLSVEANIFLVQSIDEAAVREVVLASFSVDFHVP